MVSSFVLDYINFQWLPTNSNEQLNSNKGGPAVRLSTKPIRRFRPVLTLSEEEQEGQAEREGSESSGEANLGLSTTPSSLFGIQHYFQGSSTLAPYAMANSAIIQQLTYRLPKEIKPIYYNLRLHPNLFEKTFQGFVNIGIRILKPISYIPVHTKLLNVTTDKVYQVNETTGSPIRELTPKLTFHYPDYEYWVTEFSEALDIGNYTISYNFDGSLANSIVGMYQSSYWSKERQIKR